MFGVRSSAYPEIERMNLLTKYVVWYINHRLMDSCEPEIVVARDTDDAINKYMEYHGLTERERPCINWKKSYI